MNQVHAENPESLSELRVSRSTGRRNQFAESSPFNYSCSSAPIFPKVPMVTGPRKGAPLFTPFTQASLCLDGGLITVGENHNAFNQKEFNMAANYNFNLFEQKIPNFFETFRNMQKLILYFSKFFFVDLRDCLKTVHNLIKHKNNLLSPEIHHKSLTF